MTVRLRNFATLAVALLVWDLVSWSLASTNFVIRASGIINARSHASLVQANALASSVDKTARYLAGIPNLLSHSQRIQTALSSPAAPAQRLALDRFLAQARTDLNVDAIFIADAAGSCIAASDWQEPDSRAGTRIADYAFFRETQTGQHGTQVLVNHRTHAMDVYFSSPVHIAGRYGGAVVVRVPTGKLSSLLGQLEAYVTDRNGVIIFAHDKSLEVKTIRGASVASLPEPERTRTYGRAVFEPAAIAPWGDEGFPSLERISDHPAPRVVSSTTVPSLGFRLYVGDAVPEFLEVQDARQTVFWVSAGVGSMVILMVFLAGAYLRHLSETKDMLETQANYDPLTHLPNRRLFVQRLRERIGTQPGAATPFAMLLIDLDGFKEVNDTWGHNMGDALLISAAARIRESVRETDTVARLGGDEFVVILASCSSQTAARHVAQKIVQALALPFNLHVDSATVSASVGIVLYPTDATEVKSLLKHADQAMYAAKHAGRNRYHFYAVEMGEAARYRRLLTKDLSEALQREQLEVLYQPIVHLETGAIRKAEALLRWTHPVRGAVNPSEFVPLAESSGLINDIGNWVFKQTVQQSVHWRKTYDPGFQISVNRSPVQFRDAAAGHEDDWQTYLHMQGLAGSGICIEITEGLLLDAESGVLEQLLELSQSGVQVSIDDFGTGYSCLAYLKKFNIDYLKIDKIFVRDLETDPNDLALCEAIITMAHRLGLKVIAEGVETPRQREILAGIGCDYGQGYLFSAPVPPAQFERLLAPPDSVRTPSPA